MRSIRNTVLFSSSITLLKILHVVGLVPYITDNSSERLNLDDGKWVGAVTARETLWAEAAYAHVKKLNCSDIFFTSSKECQRLMLVHKSSYIVHVAPFSPQGEYDVILPDEKLTRRNTHEGVLVFDPYPHANFGHLVIVFVVDVRSKFKCEHKKGIYIGKFLFSPLPCLLCIFTSEQYIHINADKFLVYVSYIKVRTFNSGEYYVNAIYRSTICFGLVFYHLQIHTPHYFDRIRQKQS